MVALFKRIRESNEKDPLESIRSLYPFSSHYAQVSGYSMHYLDEGKAEDPVVLLLHGNPTWSFYFRNVVKVLARSFRVIVPDMVGCGLSDRPTDATFRARDRIAHLDELLTHLGINQFSLVMHDWGGPIGTGLALKRFDQVERLIYLNTTLTEIEALPKIIRTAHTPLIGKFLTQLSPRFLDLTLEFGAVKRLPAEVKRGYRLPYKNRASRKAIWDFVADIPFTPAHPSYQDLMQIAEGLPRLKEKPIKILWGLKDPCFHKEMLSQIVRHFPHAEVIEFSSASHLVLEDEPERAVEAIAEFLLRERTKVPVNQEIELPATASALYRSFVTMAKTHPAHDAIITASEHQGRGVYEHTSFQELLSLVYRYQRGLLELGLSKGDRVLFLFPLGRDFLALVYACLGCGAIPVFVDPGVGTENLRRCIEDTDAQVLISQLKGYAVRFLWKKAFRHLKFHLVASDVPFAGGATLSFLKKYSGAPCPPVESTGTGFVAYTSGGTGTPKGVHFPESAVQASLEVFRTTLHMNAGERDLPLLPIFSLFNSALGITSVFPPLNPGKPLDLNPAAIVRFIDDLNIQSSFGSPTLWNKISDYCLRHGKVLSSIKRVLMAGAPVPSKVLANMQSLLPQGEAFTPYGATEALPVTLLSAREVSETSLVASQEGWQGTLVGKAVPGVEIQCIARTEGALSSFTEVEKCGPRSIGEIVVKGAQVSPSYLHRPDATTAAKIPDGESFWHRMGDMGYLDEEGRLYFCGRKIHAVHAFSSWFYSIPVERVANEHPKVARSALVKLSDKREIGLVVEPRSGEFPTSSERAKELKGEIEALLQNNSLTRPIKEIFFHPSFPVDGRHNAKIFRDVLGIWATKLPPGKLGDTL